MSKISITPVGTCRINTPLRRGSARYPIRLDLQRIYGFVHTSEEALQQLTYRRGECVFPSEVLPILFRSSIAPGNEPPQDKPADLTIIEISSTKSLKIGDVAVQSNYLIRYFADFFAARGRAKRYWELASSGDIAGLQAYLEGEPVFRQMSAEDQALLSAVRMGLQSYDQVQADMGAMVDMIGKDRVLFVTHVNAVSADGAVVASRDKLIRWVKTTAQRLGVECFDPTALMLEFGQERAMEREGLDLTHFTNAFYDRWFARVQRDHVLARASDGEPDVDGSGQSDSSILVESIAAALEHDDFFDGARQLYAALKLHPDSVSLQLLQGQILTRIGDFDGAAKLLSRHVDALEMTAEVRQSLMRVLLETGDAAGALAIAEQMLGDEYENVEVYEIAGLASDRLGQERDAMRYRKLAFRLDPSNCAAAVSVLGYLRAAGESEMYADWLREVLEILESRGDHDLATGMTEWAIASREEEVFSRAIVVLARSDMVMLPALIEDSVRVGMDSAIASAAGTIAAMPNLTEKTARALRAQAQNWAEVADTRFQEGRWQEAYSFAAACLSVMPTNSIARKVQRSVVDSLRDDVRAADSDEAVIALCAAAGDIVYQRRAITVLYARALLKQGRLDEAKHVARRTYDEDPEDIDAQGSYAQIAALAGDFPTALEQYGSLAQAEPDRTVRYRAAIDRFMASAGAKGIRYIRDMLARGHFDQAITASHLLQQHVNIPERIASENLRIRSALRTQLRRLDEEAGGHDEAQQILSLMLSIAPNDASVVRRSAIEAMKQQDFERAVELWQKLEQILPGLASATNNLHRSQAMARRKARNVRPARPNRLMAG